MPASRYARIRERLARLATEMARGQDMPSEFIEDYGLDKHSSKKAKNAVLSSAAAAHRQCEGWALEMLELLDELRPRATK